MRLLSFPTPTQVVDETAIHDELGSTLGDHCASGSLSLSLSLESGTLPQAGRKARDLSAAG